VLILTKEALADLAANGTVAADSCVDLARSYVGIAVKAGARHPDISTEAALRTTLLGARCVAYSRIGASGIFFAKLIEQMGLAPEVNARAMITSGFTAERLVSDEADLAVQQLSELKLVPGIELVGPLPLHLQPNPAVFSAGRMAEFDGYIGYQEPYATGHQALDKDEAVQQDVRSAATTLARAIKMQAEHKMRQADDDLRPAVLK